MVKAQQIERDGTKHGAVRTFTDDQWKQLNETYGKKLRWTPISEVPEEKPDEIEYPSFNDDPDDYPDPIGELEEKLDNMTKKMIISEYKLPKEDIKLNRMALINKVLNLKE